MVNNLSHQIRTLEVEVRRLKSKLAGTHAGASVSAAAISGTIPSNQINQVDDLIAVLLRLPPTDLTIAAGAITVTRSHHRVDTQAAAATDDLDTITAAATNQILVLRPVDDARTTVIKHNTGNILCVGNADISLDDQQDFAVLVWDGVAGKWYAQLAGGGGAGASISRFYIPFGSDMDGIAYSP